MQMNHAQLVAEASRRIERARWLAEVQELAAEIGDDDLAAPFGDCG